MISSQGDKDLSFFCKSHSSFKTRLAILSLYQARFSKWLEILLITFEYLQLLSLTILIHPTVHEISQTNIQESYAFEVVAYFFKLVNPSYLLSFSGSNSTTNAVLAIILTFTLLKTALICHVAYMAYFNRQVRKPVKDIWRWIFKLQPRVVCCFITSFWVRCIVESSFDIKGTSSRVITVISVILILMEYMISFALETQFCDFLPTKQSILSAKNYDMQILTLLQKLVIQVIQLCAYKDLTACLWACVILNLLISITREYRLFTTLPLYDSQSLFYQGDLIAIALALHVVHFFQQILKSANYSQETDLRFIIISWIFIGIFCWRLSRALLENIFIKLLTSYHPKENPNLLLHKIFATKCLVRNLIIPTKRNLKSDFKFLVGATESENILKVFNLKPKLSRLQISLTNNKQEIKAIFLEYLDDLASRFPKDSLIKLTQAHRNYKSLKFHSKIIKIVSKLNANIWSPYYTSSVLLFHDLEISAATTTLNNSNSTLNIINYIKNQLLNEDLSKQISKEIDLRKQICSHIIQETSDLETVYQNSQSISKTKAAIFKKMHYFMHNVSEHYLRPLAILAEYNLLLNYSIEEYRKFYGHYLRKSIKFTKELENPDLCEENLYQDTNAFLIISADKLESGSITYSTQSLQDICGFDQTNYQNTDITKLFPPSLRSQYSKIFKEIFEKGQNDFSNKIVRVYLYHKEGYLVDADIFIRVHPYVSQNLYLDMLIRPKFSYENAILLDQTGKVESATKGMVQFLKMENISKNSLNIKQISSELFILNSAFSLIKHRRKENNSSPEWSPRNFNKKKKNSFSPAKLLSENPFSSMFEAEELYNLYTNGGKLIGLSPFSQKEIGTPLPTTSFKCKISTLDCLSSTYHLIKLERSVSNRPGHEDDFSGGSTESSRLSSSDESSGVNLDLQEREQVKEIPFSTYLNTMTSRDLCLTTQEGVRTLTNHILPTQINHTQYNETEENLILSPTSTRALLKTLPSPTKNPRRKVTFKFDLNSPKMNQQDDPNNHLRQNLFKSNVSVTTHQSEISHISDVFRTFERAITLKSYQKSFSFLCLIFYGVILMTLAAEIVLKTILDNTMNNLIIKTNLLNYAQLRTYHVTKIQNTARGSALTIAGQLTPTQLGIADKQLKGNVVNMWSSLDILMDANDGILNNIESESEEIKQILFQKDINITGNMNDPTDTKSELMTSFQQVDLISQAASLLSHLDPIASDAGNKTFKFIIANSVNDFLAKNEEIIDIFQTSVNNQKETLQDMVKLSVIVLPLILGGIVALLTIIIYKQYQKERENLLAFLKLNPIMIQHILENLKTFQRKLARLEDFSEELSPNVIYRLEYSSQFNSGYHKNHELKIINSSNMKKRYIGYVCKVLFYISLLIIIVIANYVSISKATQVIYKRQGQLQYANQISTTLSVTYIAEVEAFASNNTNPIMRQQPFELMRKGMKKVSQVQKNLYAVYQEKDGSFDPEIAAILFKDVPCENFHAASNVFCISLGKLGQSTKMVSTLALYKNYMDSKVLAYKAVDKYSYTAMIKAALINLNYGVAAFSVSAAEAQLINGVISRKLLKSVDEIYDLATTILVIFSVTLVVLSLLIWFQVLTKVKEVNNNFKKVLAVFPPNIILSSFLLKSFLNRTSGIKQKL